MNNNIKCIPFPEIENAYIVISGHKADNANGCKKCMSFFYDSGPKGCEWEPEYGPITILYACGKGHPEAKKHWFYEYFTGNQHWSQLSVNSENLPEKFLSGDYKGVFSVLKEWCNYQ